MKRLKPHIDYWEVKVHKPPLKSIQSISRKPCKITRDNEELIMVNCTSQEATFWSVTITDNNGDKFTVADCKNEQIAIAFENWLLEILKLLSGNRIL